MKIAPAFRLALLAFGLLLALPADVASAKTKVDAKNPAKPYPLQTCLVTDNDLGSMGDERAFVYEGQEIKICCKPCERKFLKNPERYLKKLEEQIASQNAAPREK